MSCSEASAFCWAMNLACSAFSRRTAAARRSSSEPKMRGPNPVSEAGDSGVLDVLGGALLASHLLLFDHGTATRAPRRCLAVGVIFGGGADWPPAPTMSGPAAFPEVASGVVNLFAAAATKLAHIKSRRSL